ncbi:hypothetical protein QYF36_021934 [Acer negundo]|nr:hypothetical protein QYF36_021934 [Acer negundo]
MEERGVGTREEKKNRDKRTGEEKREEEEEEEEEEERKKEREKEVDGRWRVDDECQRRGSRRRTPTRLQLYQVFKSLIFFLHFNRQ